MSVRVSMSALILALAAVSAAAAPLSMPARRQGSWQITMSAPGMPGGGMTMRECSDPVRDRTMGAFGGPLAGGRPGAGGPPRCAKREFHPVAGGWAFHTVCATPRGTAETTGVVTGDFQTHYHVTIDAHAGGQSHHMTMDARWVGACRPGTPPAMILPNGQVMTMPGAG